jgi:hypothetical protein
MNASGELPPNSDMPSDPPPASERPGWLVAAAADRNWIGLSAAQLDVEQHCAWAKLIDRSERRGPVLSFTQDLEPLSLQQRPDRRPEPIMVVDDHHRRLHQQMVPPNGSRASGLPLGPHRCFAHTPATRDSAGCSQPAERGALVGR